MQLFTLSTLTFSAIAAAAPRAAPEAGLATRGGGSDYCCPSGGKYSCSPCAPSQPCPDDKPDKYSSCSENTQVGVANVFVCDVLNDLTVAIPIDINVL